MSMIDGARLFHEQVNYSRYKGQPEGFYESFFLRANHPHRPLAFWIRYTVFSPKGDLREAQGELWSVFFNAETGRHTAVKKELPVRECMFDTTGLNVSIGDARLTPTSLTGAVFGETMAMLWDLVYTSDAPPLLLLPYELYEKDFPKAKSLVGLPLAKFNGKLQVNGETIDIADWVGSQNHNWGVRHTDLYAWGQVAGFDTHPESFLEVATAKLKFGPFWTPAFTPLVLRHNGREHQLNSLLQTVKAKGRFDYFTWRFSSETDAVSIRGTMTAPREAFVCLTYRNPPGGTKFCLNTKIASCSLTVTDKAKGTTEELEAKHRAAFEILTQDSSHGIPVSI